MKAEILKFRKKINKQIINQAYPQISRLVWGQILKQINSPVWKQINAPILHLIENDIEGGQDETLN